MSLDFQHISHLNSQSRQALANLEAIENEKQRLTAQTRALAELNKKDQIAAALRLVPIERLREIAELRTPFEALKRAHILTIADLYLRSVDDLARINGVSEATARELKAVANRMSEALGATIHARIELESESAETISIMKNLESIAIINEFDRQSAEHRSELTETLQRNLPLLAPTSGRIKWFFTSGAKKDQARKAIGALEQISLSITESAIIDRASQVKRELASVPASVEDVKRNYEKNASDYLAIFEDIVEEIPIYNQEHGEYSEDLIEKILARDFDANLLNATLRKYQIFGIKFALTQGRVIIGDEMGLGKTMQALGVLTQVRKEGGVRFLIICPASVIVNWEREIKERTGIESIRIHGADQEQHRDRWLREGGIGLTTFDTLKNFGLSDADRKATGLDLVIVDEAHFAKNLGTARSIEIQRWIQDRPRLIFLSGTPMENRVSEFLGLAGLVNQQLASTLDSAVLASGPEPFKKAVAEIYLRRNVNQVLAELPAIVETEESCSWDGADMDFYTLMVQRGNFMGMRRAAYQAKPGGQTDKMNRLLELVEQAHESGQRVIVFSFFTTVIREVALKLGEGALEPITGAVSPKRRQEIVDAFTEAKEPKVLIGQIQAAGTGLNIQAASVIILCEPQIKPTLETQAIARAHRMGQVRTVRVHRLVIPQSIDSEMMNMLYNKTLEFDTYARPSHLADLVDHQMVDEQVAGGQLAESRLAEPEAKFASTLIRMERERLALDTSAPVELEDHVV